MAPNLTTASALFLEATSDQAVFPPSKLTNRQTQASHTSVLNKRRDSEVDPYKWQIVWRNVIGFAYLHFGLFYGIYLAIFSAKLVTFLWALFVAVCAGIGVTGGAHRLWCHRSYKAKWPLRLLLACFQTMAFQNHIYEWVRDHRVHHKFSDTDADPHNSKRGFFFSHMGWLVVRKHPDVKTKGQTVDMRDLDDDPIVVWQKRTYLVVMPLLCFVFPAWVPIHFWGEDMWNAWHVAAVMRYTLSLHSTWLVNSAAHMWGTKPFDRNISAAENVPVAMLAFGEGWHNYHHAFPWDYKAAELGTYRRNLTTGFIDFFAKIGWAYDLKTVSEEMIQRRLKRTGDGTHPSCSAVGRDVVEDKELHIWGWGDRDMPDEDIKEVNIKNKKKTD